MKDYRTVRECALALLEFRDRTERELRQKLKEREYSAGEIEETVLFLKEYRYLDDEAYAGRYIRSCAARKSRRQIRADLERKGVSREVIDLQLQEEEVDEDSQIRKLLQKKGYEPGKRLEATEYRRIMGTLGRRGFSGEAIRRTRPMTAPANSFQSGWSSCASTLSCRPLIAIYKR